MMINRQRGALKHWLLGCGLVLVIVVAVVIAGGYAIYTRMAPTQFSTANKADPPADADRDKLFPLRVGSFRRTAQKADTPRSLDDPTSLTMAAVYEDPDTGKLATVIAVNVAESKRAAATGDRKPGLSFTGESPPPDIGIGAKMPFGPMKAETAVWGKKNWSYLVQTTDTSAVKFAEEFKPGGEAEATGK